MPSLTSEQAERLSQLELQNDILFVGLLIWGAALLFWLLYNFVRLMIELKREVVSDGEEIRFICEKCGSPFTLSAQYLTDHPFIPRKSMNVRKGAVERTASSAIRLTCPVCKEKAWCRQDMSQTYTLTRVPVQKVLRRRLPGFFIVSAVLFVAYGIFSAVVKMIFG